jgi:hypothetical protein
MTKEEWDEYCQKYFANQDCPACGSLLDETGRIHLDGTICEER